MDHVLEKNLKAKTSSGQNLEDCTEIMRGIRDNGKIIKFIGLGQDSFTS